MTKTQLKINMKRLSNSIFEGIRESNPKSRQRVERDRHVKFVGELTPQLKGIDPVGWVKAFVKTNGVNRTKAFFTNPSFGMLPIVINKQNDFYNTKLGKANLAFYQNAYGYFKNHILKDK